jgi:hypothetical protein
MKEESDSGSERVASRKGTPVPSTADDAVPSTSTARASEEEMKNTAETVGGENYEEGDDNEGM